MGCPLFCRTNSPERDRGGWSVLSIHVNSGREHPSYTVLRMNLRAKNCDPMLLNNRFRAKTKRRGGSMLGRDIYQPFKSEQ